MTIREAVELVLEAAAIGQQDTNTDGRIFVLDMGEPVKIVDLARQMIRLSGKEPDRDIEIVFTGARPGEKLFEEVLHGDETTVKTAHAGLLLAAPRVTERAELQKQFDQLFATAHDGDMADVRKHLQTLIPEYTTET
jgi:O-antigen biosynthesis protein WbqV